MGLVEPDGAIFGGVTEDYARQIVSEGRKINPANGKAQWIPRHKDNHFLDCESMAAAAAYMLRVHTIPEGTVRVGEGADLVTIEPVQPAPVVPLLCGRTSTKPRLNSRSHRHPRNRAGMTGCARTAEDEKASGKGRYVHT